MYLDNDVEKGINASVCMKLNPLCLVMVGPRSGFKTDATSFRHNRIKTNFYGLIDLIHS